MYSVVSYFAAKTVAEMVVTFFVVLVMFGLAWPCMGLHGNFFLYLLTAWLLALAAGSTALYLGSAVASGQKALTLAPAIFVPQILFSGLFLPSSEVPLVLRWVQYICALKYGINLFAIIELDSYPAGSPEAAVGAYALDKMDVKVDQAWLYVAVLLAITIGFRILAMASLRSKARFVF